MQNYITCICDIFFTDYTIIWSYDDFFILLHEFKTNHFLTNSINFSKINYILLMPLWATEESPRNNLLPAPFFGLQDLRCTDNRSGLKVRAQLGQGTRFACDACQAASFTAATSYFPPDWRISGFFGKGLRCSLGSLLFSIFHFSRHWGSWMPYVTE